MGVVFAVGVTGVLAVGCMTFERGAIDGSIKSAFLEINTPDGGLTKLADDLYTFKWYGYRTAFVTTTGGVIVFDPLNADAAAKLSREITRVDPNPTIRYVSTVTTTRTTKRGRGNSGVSPSSWRTRTRLGRAPSGRIQRSRLRRRRSTTRRKTSLPAGLPCGFSTSPARTPTE
jgi:hypothetical protein